MENKPKYRRILLKLSGEALSGTDGVGIDTTRAEDIAQRVGEVRSLGVDVGIVIGGGNLWRGRIGLESGMDRATAITWACCIFFLGILPGALIYSSVLLDQQFELPSLAFGVINIVLVWFCCIGILNGLVDSLCSIYSR